MNNNYFLPLAVLACHVTVAQEKADVFDVARSGTVEQAKEMLKANPKAFDAINADGYSTLILACYRGNNEVAKLLIDHGGNLNYMSGMGTALMACVVKNNVEIAKYLLAKKADPNLADGNGNTALIYAAMFKNHDIATALIQAGAKADIKDKKGKSAVDYAILADDDRLIQILKTK